LAHPQSRRSGRSAKSGSEPVDEMPPIRVPVVPHLLLREVSTALALTAAVLVFSIFFDAALCGAGQSGFESQPGAGTVVFCRASRSCCCIVHPTVAVCDNSLLAGFFLVSIPYLAYPRSTEGIWFASARGKRQSIKAAITAMVVISALDRV
jgi:hypothetical protein